jgi:hypothetical protein
MGTLKCKRERINKFQNTSTSDYIPIGSERGFFFLLILDSSYNMLIFAYHMG